MVGMYTTRIIQILDNLLANAMTFHDSDMPITLAVKRCAHKQISLADKGLVCHQAKKSVFLTDFIPNAPPPKGLAIIPGLGCLSPGK